MTACALCSGYAEERGNLYINRSLKLNPLPEGTKAPVRKIHRRRVPIASWCIHIFLSIRWGGDMATGRW